MADVKRFLSGRAKDGSHRRQRSRDKSSGDKKVRPGILDFFKHDPQKKVEDPNDEQKKLDKEQDDKMERLKILLAQRDDDFSMSDAQMKWALQSRYSSWDADRAFELLVLLQESVEGVIKPYDASIEMQGAVNRMDVSCYLDSVLFAMFAKLDSFEPMLYTHFEDESKRNLAALLRFWVNLLRTGKLIEVQITTQLMEACAACDWPPDGIGKLYEQQDASAYFGFITETLQLPLLELKQNIYYDSGRVSNKDDVRITNERMLDVAVPDEIPGAPPVKLEHCLELYFNNEIQVRRSLNRSDTASSVRSNFSTSSEKGDVVHIETRELTESNPGTPLSIQPSQDPISRLTGRHRTDSLITTRITSEGPEEESPASPKEKKRKEAKEVMIPAYQFFNLMPWLTPEKIMENTGAMMNYFQERAPIVCIHLKRYGMVNDQLVRKNTLLDIPIELRLPHFVDDRLAEGGPIMGNFKLSLQSVICHIGERLDSGHYISFVQIGPHPSKRHSSSSQPPPYSSNQWIKHDDLGKKRVEQVDIELALKNEMPFLLFYQVRPLYEHGHYQVEENDPPAYEHDSGIDVKISESSPLVSRPDESYFDGARRASIRSSPEMEPRRSLNIPEERGSSLAAYTETSPERATHITLPLVRRGSAALTEDSLASPSSGVITAESRSAPSTPNEETAKQKFVRAASRIAGNRSRPTSSSGENRMSATFSRFGLRSEKQLAKPEQHKDIAHSTVSLPPVITGDGPADQHSLAINFEDEAAHAPGSKRGVSTKNRGKSPAKENHEPHHKGKSHKELPDRQCSTQ